jgi:hypothetical protein
MHDFIDSRSLSRNLETLSGESCEQPQSQQRLTINQPNNSVFQRVPLNQYHSLRDAVLIGNYLNLPNESEVTQTTTTHPNPPVGCGKEVSLLSLRAHFGSLGIDGATVILD